MFLMECISADDSKINLRFVTQERQHWKCEYNSNYIDEVVHSFKTLMLFDHEYHRNASIQFHNDELFSFARKYFQLLNKAARNNYTLAIFKEEKINFGILRQNISSFFIHIREILDDVYYLVGKNNIEIAKTTLQLLKQNIFSFRLMLKSMETLPDFVIRASSEIGNQSGLSSFHLFHSHLDLHWLHLTISIKIYLLEPKLVQQDTLANSEDNINFSEYQSTPSIQKTLNSDVEKELEWIIYNFVLLANKCFDKMERKNVFSCGCVKQIWITTQMLVENLHSQSITNNFWHYYNIVFRKYILQTIETDNIPKRCDRLFIMNKIDCTDRLEFSLWLLVHIAKLEGYDFDGNYVGVTSQRVKPNYEFLEEIIKQFMKDDEQIPEAIFREQMQHIVKLLTVWWDPKNDIITLLWEYFHKRLNSAFSITGQDNNPISIASSNIPEIIDDLKSRLSMEGSTKRQFTADNSFSLFITLLGIHLKSSFLANQQSNFQRIKGRILPKFTINKIVALNELGLQNFSTIFLMMSVATDLDMASKLQNLVVQIPFDSLPWSKKQVIVKTHLCVLYLYSDTETDITNAAKPITQIAIKYCNMRDSESMALMKMIVNGILDVLDVSKSFKSNEHILIESWFTKYLSFCSIPDMSQSLESLSSLISKISILCSYQDVSSDSIQQTVDAVLNNILNCVKTLYANGTMALQIADTAFNFTKFIFNNPVRTQKHASFKDILKYFLMSENSNERVTHHYLVQVLQDDIMMQSFNGEHKCCCGCIVNCWIRCTLLSEEQSEDDTHLVLLMSQLADFKSFNVTPSCQSADQRNLCRFFHAVGMKWNNSQTFQQKCQLREQFNEYVALLDKYVMASLKTPPSPEYAMQILLVLGTLFLHCSPIIYLRAKPTCLLHNLVSNILLPPQLFMEKKLHPYIISAVCKSWYMFMRGLFNLDYKNDIYVEKTMKDMIVQYIPLFANKTVITKNNTFDIIYKIIPSDVSHELQLEKYILDKISVNFITCRGKQSNVHAAKALAVVHHTMTSTNNIQLFKVAVSCTLVSVLEQFMFSDPVTPNKKIVTQIMETVCNSSYFKNDQENLQTEVTEILAATCRKHLAFSSGAFFKLILHLLELLLPIMDVVISHLDNEISKVERMRGVGYDHGLRNGINEIITSYSKIKQTHQ